jgi:DNA polymerase III alpha subunit
MTDEYIKRMTGTKHYEVHKEVKDILGETHGIIIFQEQCMALLSKLGGFSDSETNKVRKLLIKKSDVKTANKYEKQFMDSATKKVGKEQAESLWQEMVRMSEYAFCKAHAVSYTLLATFDLWLKYYYGIEFYTAILNNLGQGDLEKIRSTIQRIYGKTVYFHIGNKKL